MSAFLVVAITRMHELERPEHLVQEVLVVVRGQVVVGLDDLVKVGVHQFKHHEQVPVALGLRGQQDVLDLHNICGGGKGA